MPAPASRDIATSHTRDVPREFLQSMFVCELLTPSRPLWIVSPWISDVALVENSARQFGAICPGWPATQVRLAHIIEALVDRGGEVAIVVNNDPHNDHFLQRLEILAEANPQALRWRRTPHLHTKGIVSERFCLDGSMNLTHTGVYRNDEHLIYRTDPQVVQERRLELQHFWEGLS